MLTDNLSNNNPEIIPEDSLKELSKLYVKKLAPDWWVKGDGIAYTTTDELVSSQRWWNNLQRAAYVFSKNP